MPLIDVEQAVEAVGRCAQAAGGQAVESDVLKRVCRALRAIEPQEPSEAEVERVAMVISECVASGLFGETGDVWWRDVARSAIAAMRGGR